MHTCITIRTSVPRYNRQVWCIANTLQHPWCRFWRHLLFNFGWFKAEIFRVKKLKNLNLPNLIITFQSYLFNWSARMLRNILRSIKFTPRDSTIAKWIRLRLPSCGAGFESQAKRLCFYRQSLYYICHCVEKWTKIKTKRGQVWPTFKKFTSTNRPIAVPAKALPNEIVT